MATIREIYNSLDSNGLFFVENVDFMNDYNANHDSIDKNIILKYGNREIAVEIFGNDMLKSFREIFYGWLISQKDNLQRIYEAIKKEYEPLENYNKTSTITTSYSGNEKSINSGTSTTSYDGKESSTNTESESVVLSGSEKNEDLNPQMTTTTTNRNTDFESDTFYNNTESKEIRDSITTTNTKTFDNRKDETEKSSIFEKEFTNRKDIEEVNLSNVKSFEDRKDIVEEKTFGNIGVTTNDQMLKSFIDLRFELDFYNDIFKRFLFDYTW